MPVALVYSHPSLMLEMFERTVFEVSRFCESIPSEQVIKCNITYYEESKPLLESSPSKVIFFEAEYLWVK